MQGDSAASVHCHSAFTRGAINNASAPRNKLSLDQKWLESRNNITNTVIEAINSFNLL